MVMQSWKAVELHLLSLKKKQDVKFLEPRLVTDDNSECGGRSASLSPSDILRDV